MKNNIIVIGVIAFLLIGVGIFMLNGKKSSSKKVSTQTQETIIDESEENYAPLDKNVTFKVVRVNNDEDLAFEIQNIPAGTTNLEYQVSYTRKTIKGKDEGDAGDTIDDGAFGNVPASEFINNGFSNIPAPNNPRKPIKLGTCSSGRCVLHSITGPINIMIVFNGSYGKQKLEQKI